MLTGEFTGRKYLDKRNEVVFVGNCAWADCTYAYEVSYYIGGNKVVAIWPSSYFTDLQEVFC